MNTNHQLKKMREFHAYGAKRTKGGIEKAHSDLETLFWSVESRPMPWTDTHECLASHMQDFFCHESAKEYAALLWQKELEAFGLLDTKQHSSLLTYQQRWILKRSMQQLQENVGDQIFERMVSSKLH